MDDGLISADLLSLLDVDIDSYGKFEDSPHEDSSPHSSPNYSFQRMNLLLNRSCLDLSLSTDFSTHTDPYDYSLSLLDYDYDAHLLLPNSICTPNHNPNSSHSPQPSPCPSVISLSDYEILRSPEVSEPDDNNDPFSSLPDQSINQSVTSEQPLKPKSSVFSSILNSIKKLVKTEPGQVKQESTIVKTKPKKQSIIDLQAKKEGSIMSKFDYDCWDSVYDEFFEYFCPDVICDATVSGDELLSDEILVAQSDLVPKIQSGQEHNYDIPIMESITCTQFLTPTDPQQVNNDVIVSPGFSISKGNSNECVITLTCKQAVEGTNQNSNHDVSLAQNSIDLTRNYLKFCNWNSLFRKFCSHSDLNFLSPTYSIDLSLSGISKISSVKLNQSEMIDCALDLSMNKISSFSDFHNCCLRMANFSYNKINQFQRLSGSFLSYSLQILILHHNNLSSLDGVSSFEYLKYLDISNNPVKNSFALPQTLHTLIAKSCGFSSINISSNHKNLKYLDFSFNPLTLIDAICLFSTLQYLNISNCELLSSLPSVMPSFLKVLKARNCAFSDVQLHLSHLENLILSHNKISKISLNCPNLKILDISFNQIGLINFESILNSYVPSLISLNIVDNCSDLVFSDEILARSFPSLTELNSEEFKHTRPINTINQNFNQSCGIFGPSQNENVVFFTTKTYNSLIKEIKSVKIIMNYWRSRKFRISHSCDLHKFFKLWHNQHEVFSCQNFAATKIGSLIRGFIVRRRYQKFQKSEFSEQSSSDLSDFEEIIDLTEDFNVDVSDVHVSHDVINSLKSRILTVQKPESERPISADSSSSLTTEHFNQINNHNDDSDVSDSQQITQSIKSDCISTSNISKSLLRRQLRFKSLQRKAQINSKLSDPIKRLELFQKKASIGNGSSTTKAITDRSRPWSLDPPSPRTRVKRSAPAYLGSQSGPKSSRSRDRIKLPSLPLKNAWIEPPNS
ncbi:hypothetical protein P9112_009630 [Eukaryota sp. TZLM1-RC]